VVITSYDSAFLYVQLVSILSDHIVQANFVQFDDDFTGAGTHSNKTNNHFNYAIRLWCYATDSYCHLFIYATSGATHRIPE